MEAMTSYVINKIVNENGQENEKTTNTYPFFGYYDLHISSNSSNTDVYLALKRKIIETDNETTIYVMDEKLVDINRAQNKILRKLKINVSSSFKNEIITLPEFYEKRIREVFNEHAFIFDMSDVMREISKIILLHSPSSFPTTVYIFDEDGCVRRREIESTEDLENLKNSWRPSAKFYYPAYLSLLSTCSHYIYESYDNVSNLDSLFSSLERIVRFSPTIIKIEYLEPDSLPINNKETFRKLLSNLSMDLRSYGISIFQFSRNIVKEFLEEIDKKREEILNSSVIEVHKIVTMTIAKILERYNKVKYVRKP